MLKLIKNISVEFFPTIFKVYVGIYLIIMHIKATIEYLVSRHLTDGQNFLVDVMRNHDKFYD